MTTMEMPDGTVVHLSGLPNHVPLDDETAERLAEQYPDMMWCCFQSANAEGALDALTSCTCWEPVFDLKQTDPQELELGEPTPRADQCIDCAYRHDSPEFEENDPVLAKAVDKGAFWCHQGMRRPMLWRHPLGAEIPGDPADYQPPIIKGIPYKANGTPADQCAGWKARVDDKPITWAMVRKGVDRMSLMQEEWEGIPIPLPGHRLRLRPGHPLETAARLFDEHTNGVEYEIHCGGGDVREDEFVRNEFYSSRSRCKIMIYQQGDKVFHAKQMVSPDLVMVRLDQTLNTMGASDAWDLKAEYTAREKLRGMINEHQWQHYELTGCFAERSPRSDLTYIFRRLRPTIVLSQHGRHGRTDYLRCLAVLCMHPIGYYDKSWAGCMVPTDDVIAHLLFMRGDEARYWGQANHHAAWEPEAGI